MPTDRENSGTTPDSALRQLLTNAIKRSGKSRAQIADQMAAELGARVTEAMLNDFTSQRKSAARFPAAFVQAFCRAVGSTSLQRSLLDHESLDLIEVGKHVMECNDIVRQVQSLLERLTGTNVKSSSQAKRARH